jgi:hypothetical protein
MTHFATGGVACLGRFRIVNLTRPGYCFTNFQQANDAEHLKADIELGQFFRTLKFVPEKLSFETVPLPQS